ncbi:MAG: hypothetical protein WA144_07695 [Candidatus Methanoperedens sp.]
MSSFINDEKGLIEPYTELPAMALAVVGFIVFIALLTQAYSTYQEKSFIAGHYQDAANLARKLGRDSSLTGGHPGVIDSGKLEKLDTAELFRQYGSYYNFMFKIDSNSEYRSYNIIIKNPDYGDSKIGVSASIPITVRFNDVEEQPGTLTVKIWGK